ncbi:MAG: histidinol-phosphatase [Ignavibacteriales bacterium CG_4_9_14_3_um_filter_34_10]|nr:MAG: histidinol-phosphatase [Ignavibacteriales bacterium CG_4_9_14_3_um_filter_34_10]
MNEKKMKNFIVLILFVFVSNIYLQTRARTEIQIPDILGYKTLKCDFHIHTVFSDGNVWPTVRAEEAWREGLDAISITDHLEYTPHKEDINLRYNRSSEIAKSHGDELDITVIKGSEITRSMPPGHLNAIFINDADKLKTDKWQDAVAEAVKQNAFIFWNHPGWKAQLKEGKIKMYPEHIDLIERGILKGIEVVNDVDYYPEAFEWALKYDLTIMSNSDIHDPINLYFNFAEHEQRSKTLVFAKDKSEEAIKDALINQRTVVYWKNNLMGSEKYLRPIFDNSISFDKQELSFTGRQTKFIQIKNNSEVDYKLKLVSSSQSVDLPEEITFKGNKIVLFEVRPKKKDQSGKEKIKAVYEIINMKIKPDENMKIEFLFSAEFNPAK